MSSHSETDHLRRIEQAWAPKEQSQAFLQHHFQQNPFIGHRIFHVMAQSGYLADIPGKRASTQEDPLRDIGFVPFPGLLSPEQVKNLKAKTQELFDQEPPSITAGRPNLIQSLQKTLDFEDHIRNAYIPDAELAKLISLGTDLSRGKISELIETHYESYFQISQCLMYRTLPTENPKLSFRWHRDAAPETQLHLMIFLQDGGADGSGGMIEMLPAAPSKRMDKEFNYKSPEVRSRVADLREAGAPDEVISNIYRPHIKAGDAILFAANRILHKGIAPKEGVRDVLTFIFLPSLNPWKGLETPQIVEKWRARTNGYDSLRTNPLEI